MADRFDEMADKIIANIINPKDHCPNWFGENRALAAYLRAEFGKEPTEQSCFNCGNSHDGCSESCSFGYESNWTPINKP